MLCSRPYVNGDVSSTTDTDRDATAAGRRLLLAVGGVAVLLAAGVGLFVGAQSADRGVSVTVFGLVALPDSPAVVAVYAGLLAAVTLAVLFGAVTVASRIDGDRA